MRRGEVKWKGSEMGGRQVPQQTSGEVIVLQETPRQEGPSQAAVGPQESP